MSGIIKKNLGLIILLSSLLIYSLIKLPLNLSVLCNSENEGFYFVYGKALLEWREYTCGPFFIILYAFIVKLLGFNTYSIIAVHFVQNIVVILIALILYFLVKRSLNSNVLGSLSVVFWLFFILTPQGHMSNLTEILTHFGLEAEYFCILFSLLSLLCLQKSKFFQLEKTNLTLQEKFLFFLSGSFSLFTLMFKVNGLGLFLSLFFFFLILLIFERPYYKILIKKFVYILFGIVFSIGFFQIFPWIFNIDSFVFWKKYFIAGSYSQEHLTSLNLFFINFIKFMTRDSSSFTNFMLFLITCLLFLWGFARYFLFRSQEKDLSRFWLLLSLWGVANIFLIIAPGIYQPYYYHLIWPIVSIVLVLGIRDLLHFSSNRYQKKIAWFVTISLIFFFVSKLFLVFPTYLDLYSRIKLVSIFNQTESFQDPVLSNIQNPLRPNFLKFADTINNLLLNENDTFYVFNFNKEGPTNFTSASYIYAKRFPPTHTISDHLHYPNILSERLEDLKKVLIARPPRIFVISKDVYMKPWQVEILTPFIKWFNDFLASKYTLKLSLVNKQISSGNEEVFFVYERKT